MRVADHAVVPGVGRLDRLGPLGGGDGVPEAVLRGEHRAEHPLRLVARAGGDRGAQGAFRLDRQAAVAGRAGLAQQRIGEPRGRDAVAGLVRDPALERGDGLRETVARRRRAARRSGRQRHRGVGARRPRTPHVHAGGGKGAHDHRDPRSQFLQRRHARLRSGSGSTPESITIRLRNVEVIADDSGVVRRRLRSRVGITGCRPGARPDTGRRAGKGRRCRRRRRRSRCSASVLNAGVSGVAPAAACSTMSSTSSPTRRPFGKPATSPFEHAQAVVARAPTASGGIAMLRRSISDGRTFGGWFRPGMPVRKIVTRSLRGAGGESTPKIRLEQLRHFRIGARDRARPRRSSARCALNASLRARSITASLTSGLPRRDTWTSRRCR